MAQNRFLKHAGIELPIIGGPMFPCSNPELVAAVSESGGIGIIQPISLNYVHGYEFRQGLNKIRQLTTAPVGMNALIEKSSKRHHDQMVRWIDIAIEEGVRFFITSLGNPSWVVEKVHAVGGAVYHDVTEEKWAIKGLEAGVDGLIAVNRRAGGHAGQKTAAQLYEELSQFDCPIVCAGGIASADEVLEALSLGYEGVQMGTRFIATAECNASESYKKAIVDAKESDIVLTERITGIPVSVIETLYVKKVGTKVNIIARWFLKHRKLKYLFRAYMFIRSLWRLKSDNQAAANRASYWQAGKSVEHIDSVMTVAEIMEEYRSALAKKP